MGEMTKAMPEAADHLLACRDMLEQVQRLQTEARAIVRGRMTMKQWKQLRVKRCSATPADPASAPIDPCSNPVSDSAKA